MLAAECPPWPRLLRYVFATRIAGLWLSRSVVAAQCDARIREYDNPTRILTGGELARRDLRRSGTVLADEIFTSFHTPLIVQQDSVAIHAGRGVVGPKWIASAWHEANSGIPRKITVWRLKNVYDPTPPAFRHARTLC